MYKAAIHVTLKKSVLDPQGKTVLHALDSLGFKEAKDLRVGKYFELTLEASDPQKAEAHVRQMCDK
ncbi:MAG TPA: phosphoribosylformylglycinamidine synthase subunit PurS, partial [bacterium]|nr:phosphoribosylformylglycinamidine synthase subunit PurS [bacterium]